MANIRRAMKDEKAVLTRIAIESEAYWGYDKEFMTKFEAIYAVTDQIISDNATYIIEDRGIIGFYSVQLNRNEAMLEYFYIRPTFIGKGYGRKLWKHLVSNCINAEAKTIEIITSPQAKDFYIKMGALQVGHVVSLVQKERQIPKLIYTIFK